MPVTLLLSSLSPACLPPAWFVRLFPFLLVLRVVASGCLCVTSFSRVRSGTVHASSSQQSYGAILLRIRTYYSQHPLIESVVYRRKTSICSTYVTYWERVQETGQSVRLTPLLSGTTEQK